MAKFVYQEGKGSIELQRRVHEAKTTIQGAIKLAEMTSEWDESMCEKRRLSPGSNKYINVNEEKEWLERLSKALEILS